jgi:general secretion pathway protein G
MHSGSRRAGFTLVEMMIVMAVIVILVGIAIPRYQKAIIRAKETVLHSNLAAIRNAIDEYSYDKQKAPQTLQDLVTDGYLREIPKDPITGNNEWREIQEDATQSVDSSEPGLFDIHSESSATSPIEQTPYSDW